MAALTKDHSLDRAEIAHALSYIGVAADAVEIYKGSYLQQSAAGYAVMVGDPLATGPVIAVAEKNVPDQTGASDGDATIRGIVGQFDRPIAAANPVTDADMFQPVYAANNFDVTNDQSKPLLGVMVGINNEAGTCTVLISTANKSLANATGIAFASAPLGEATLDDGTALAAWVDGVGATPGHDMAGGEYKCIRWNPNATPDGIAISFGLPLDLDTSKDVNVYLLVAKEAAGGDLPTFDVGAYFNQVGAAYDADADAGATSNALTDTAKTIQLAAVTIAAADVPDFAVATPTILTLTVTPTAGTLPVDDVLLGAVMLVYARK